MRLSTLIKDFDFEEANRDRVVLGAGTRLDPLANAITLVADSITGKFDTSPAGFTARTWVTAPACLHRWGIFQASTMNAVDELGNDLTGARYRLSDGTTDFWWNGSAWAAPGPSDWNTEAEVSANASLFLSRSMQVVVNLWTNDEHEAPLVYGLRFAWSGRYDAQENVIFRSLIPAMKAGVKPISDYVVDLPSTGGPHTVVDLANDYPLETPYIVVGVDSVFDVTNDPDEFTDVFSAYNPTTKVVTLSPGVPDGARVKIRLIYEPSVTVMASQDAQEVARVPAIVFDSISFRGNQIGARDGVVDRSTFAAVKLERPWMGDVDISCSLMTEKQVDHQRLSDEVKRFFSDNPFVTIRGVDERARLWLLTPQFESTNVVNKADINSSRFRFRVCDVIVSPREFDAYGVERLALTTDPVS